MESPTVGHSFPPHAPIRYTITIIHLLFMSIAFLGFYPYTLTQRASRSSHNKHRLMISLGCAVSFTFVGVVTGWHSSATSKLSLLNAGLNLSLFLLTILDYYLEYIDGHHLPQEQQSSTLSRLYSWMNHVPETVHVVLRGITVCLGYFYLIHSVFVLTSTCQSLDQYLLPLSMGLGFILFGSVSFMHLINTITIPRHTSPEYLEALWILLCGSLSLLCWDTPILGSSWKAINLGLLWTMGGILSLVISFQSSLPFLQKRNIVNSLIIFLTGKGILSGYSDDSFYLMELQITLGYVLVIGSMARFTQIMFRKSTTDNLPRLYSRALGTTGCDDADDDNDELDFGQRRATDYESTYRQLTGMNSSCKHQSIYASITLVCGLLYCFAAIAGGFFFIGAIVEWVEIMRFYIIDPSTYVNVLLSISFLWTSYLLGMCSIYNSGLKPTPSYDYLDLATGEYCVLPVYSKPSSSPATCYNLPATPMTKTNPPFDSTHNSSNFFSVPPTPMMSTKSQHHISAPSSATNTCNGSSSSSSSTTSSTPSSPRPMRPSQYRAKRRSLLIATGLQNNSHQDTNRAQRTLSASSFTGVGGILPDEVSIHGDYYSVSPATVDQPISKPSENQHTSPTLQRRSWRSGSSSPPLRASTLSTESVTSLSHRDSWWRPSNEDNTNPMLYKTESGRRKDRHWKKRKETVHGTTMSGDEQEEDAALPCSGPDGRLQFYSSERNSVNSHVF